MAGSWPPKFLMKGGPKARKGQRLYYSPATSGGGGGSMPFLTGELTLTGGFGADQDWTKDAGWAIAAGVATATATATNAFLHQAVTIVTGGTYQVTYTVSAYTSGNVKVSFDNGPSGTTRSGTGTFTEHLVMLPGAVTEIRFGRVSVDFTGSIDNVSLMRIG